MLISQFSRLHTKLYKLFTTEHWRAKDYKECT